MEECGVIRSYRIDIDRTRLDCNITGFISVSLEPEKYAAFCVFCEQSPAVISHHHVIGVFNALLQFAVRDTKELDALLAEIKTYGDSPHVGGAQDAFLTSRRSRCRKKRTKAPTADAFDVSRRLRRQRGAAFQPQRDAEVDGADRRAEQEHILGSDILPHRAEQARDGDGEGHGPRSGRRKGFPSRPRATRSARA